MKAVLLIIIIIHCIVLGLPEFTSMPVETDQGNSVKIDFTVSEYTDVTVEVLDPSGSTIRHLASGVLGPNPPAPFTANSLSQTLTWDKTDDLGNAISGNFDIKVSLGLVASFDKVIGFSGDNEIYHSGNAVNGLAIDSSGNLLVRTRAGRGSSRLISFSKGGTYQKTILPFPGSLPYDQMKGYGLVDLQDGSHIPRVYQSHHGMVVPEFLAYSRQNVSVTKSGWVILANTTKGFYGNDAIIRRLLIVTTGGACPRDSIFGPILARDGYGGNIWTALSPDDQTVYASGLRLGIYETNPLANVVFQSPVDWADTMAVFIGEHGVAGNDNYHFNDPRGIATDGQGNIYVCDFGNNRVVAYDANGAFIKSASVTEPDQIVLNRKTGESYALSFHRDSSIMRIYKLSALPGLAVQFNSVIVKQVYGDDPVMVLDNSGTNPFIWLSGHYFNRGDIHCLEDLGDRVVEVAGSKILSRRTDYLPCENGIGALEAPGYISVDPGETVLYAGCKNLRRIDLASGAISSSSIKAWEVTFGPDGYLYAWGAGNSIHDSLVRRFDLNEQQVPFAGGATEFYTIDSYFSGPQVASRGLTVAPNGDIYIIIVHKSEPVGGARVDVFGPDGSLKQAGVIIMPDSLRGIGGGIQVDLKGNIYTSYSIRPRGIKYPSIFTDPYFANPDPDDPGYKRTDFCQAWTYTYVNHYLFNIGSLFKFPPTGGHILYLGSGITGVPAGDLTASVPSLQVNGFYKRKFEVSGPLWQKFGLSLSAPHDSHGDPTCHCYSPRFTVDRFGRVFYPQAMQFSVGVMDNNRNEILTFGEYGNPDETGGGARIPLAFPVFVQQINDHVYVGDIANHRIVRANLGYAFWATTSGQTSTQMINAIGKFQVSAYPSPFNSTITLKFSGLKKENIKVSIYAADGRLIKSIGRAAGPSDTKRIVWDGTDNLGHSVGAGAYIAKIVCGNKTVTRELFLIK